MYHYSINRRTLNHPAGFTLIELLIVLAILGILAAVVLTAINPSNQINKAKDSDRVSDIHSIKQAIESYNTVQQTNLNCSSGGTCPTDYSLTGSDDVSVLLASGNYLKSMPVPPQSSSSLCDYHIFLYPNDFEYYNLRWCFEGWTESDVNNLAGNGAEYYCDWNGSEQMAVCYTGTEYDIPQL